MRVHLTIAITAAVAGLLQPGPAVVTWADLRSENSAFGSLRDRTHWLGLFLTGEDTADGGDASLLRPVRVRVVRGGDNRFDGRRAYRLDVQPEAPTLLVAGIPGVSAGPAVTLAFEEELRLPERFSFGGRSYALRRLRGPSECGLVVALESDDRQQVLFGAHRPDPGSHPWVATRCLRISTGRAISAGTVASTSS
ncbi:MAG: hypothetical protein AB1635_18060 [Acidobacteriota bacterium]